MTVPDQCLSVREILERFTRGTIDVESLKRPEYYDDNPNIDEFDNPCHDLTDFEAVINTAKDKMQSISHQIKQPLQEERDESASEDLSKDVDE